MCKLPSKEKEFPLKVQNFPQGRKKFTLKNLNFPQGRKTSKISLGRKKLKKNSLEGEKK
jgi:hypothetical protein